MADHAQTDRGFRANAKRCLSSLSGKLTQRFKIIPLALIWLLLAENVCFDQKMTNHSVGAGLRHH